MHKPAILSLLHRYQPFEKTDEESLKATLAFVEKVECPWQRIQPLGHLTASAWMVNAARTQVLLVHHAKLNAWLQPGGHVDAEDESLAEAALRETREETGLRSLQLIHDTLFDIDAHLFPAKGTAPEHWHYDTRFLIQADNTEPLTCSSESNALRWFTLEEMPGVNPWRSIQRMVEKTK